MCRVTGEKTDPTRSLLKKLMAEHSRSSAWLSRAIDRNHAYIHQYLVQGKPAVLPRSARVAIGRLFGVNPEALLSGEATTALDQRLTERARIATEQLVGGLPDTAARATVPEVFAAVYALLEREAIGHPITDDEATLRIIRELIAVIHRQSAGG